MQFRFRRAYLAMVIVASFGCANAPTTSSDSAYTGTFVLIAAEEIPVPGVLRQSTGYKLEALDGEVVVDPAFTYSLRVRFRVTKGTAVTIPELGSAGPVEVIAGDGASYLTFTGSGSADSPMNGTVRNGELILAATFSSALIGLPDEAFQGMVFRFHR